MTSVIQLEHLGEPLLKGILETSEAVRELVLSRNLIDKEAVLCEIPLAYWNNQKFDGAHRIDVAILNTSAASCVALELKLGLSRMASGEFTRRFLSGTSSSHKNTRVKGSMISILERLSMDSSSESTYAERRGERILVDSVWVLVIRRQVLEKWRTSTPPSLSKKCQIVAFEEIVESYGDRNTFNKLVSNLVVGDYYREWLSA
jgi:hypothetical protein